MLYTKRIKGTEKLLKILPEEYCFWHKFGTVLEFHLNKKYDYFNSGYIGIIEMLLADIDKKYCINMKLINVSGVIEFDIENGFLVD